MNQRRRGRTLLFGLLLAAGFAAAFVVQERRKREVDGAPYVNDAVQFWCAGRLIREGRSPYEVRGQTNFSRAAGWNANRHGAGRYDFMPFYYPFWVALAAAPLTFASFSQFLALWSLLQYAAVIAAAGILCRLGRRRSEVRDQRSEIRDRNTPLTTHHSPLACFLLIAFFPLATQVAEMGQVGNVALLAVAVLWWCGERRRDATAGVVLALLCSKPQLSVLLVPCVIVWAWRNRRYRVLWGFGGGIAGLMGMSFLVRPEWFVEFLRAPFETRMLTGDEPWKVTTWNAVLQTAGFEGFALAVLYAALAIPVVVWSLRTAWRVERKAESGKRKAEFRKSTHNSPFTPSPPHPLTPPRSHQKSDGEKSTTPLADVMSISLLAVWFLSPYARSYDMVVLLFPLMALLGRIAVAPRGCVLLAAALLPHYHQFLRWQRGAYPVAGLEIWWCWLPAALTLLWLAADRRWIAAWDAEEAAAIGGRIQETYRIAAIAPTPAEGTGRSARPAGKCRR